MTPRRRKLLIAALVLVGGCGVGAIALVPGAGPPLLAALPAGDILVKADRIDQLWRLLETSDRFRRFRSGTAWAALLDVPEARDAIEGVEGALADGVVTRWRASHLIGREAGASVSFDARGAVTTWVAAFRIDTVARAAELVVRRFALGDRVVRHDVDGRIVSSVTVEGLSVWWVRLGDLVVAAGTHEALTASIASALAAQAGSSEGWTWASRFDVPGADERSDGFRVGIRLDRPEEKLGAALGLSERDRAGLDASLRSVGLPGPVDAVSLTVMMRDGEILEDGFVRGAVGVPAAGESAPERRPANTHLWWQFRPGREEAAARAWGVMQYLRPPTEDPLSAGWETFQGLVRARLGPEVAIAVAEQPGVDSPTGGFPAEYAFFRLVGAESLREPFEHLLRQRSLGIYDEDVSEPVSYPYLVRHRIEKAWVYEMVIRNTRRHDGYRPALAIMGSDLIYASSLPALRAYLAGEGSTRSTLGRAWVESLEGTTVLALDWRTPADLRPLRNAYDYLTELEQYAPPPTAKVLAERVDYERLWGVLEDVARDVQLQQRLGVRADGGMRMRARWVLAD